MPDIVCAGLFRINRDAFCADAMTLEQRFSCRAFHARFARRQDGCNRFATSAQPMCKLPATRLQQWFAATMIRRGEAIGRLRRCLAE
ncbi:hypothetical protein M3I53_16710 [Paraburkholderia sp. CNPSo 3272]|uniref:hypothetical protein n=1 Tax=Paraburkholderia sp. CNPSo 3272 TaxID=2940931 RepID=UPI0020B7BDAC|nr:hypothetical protein [Paraburkholderia sp. CNPSo 3272]MCP3724744.1 hypothetical protein [Paraburkholderia sp. CNPSo 3272]